jgi:hypothetical protein
LSEPELSTTGESRSFTPPQAIQHDSFGDRGEPAAPAKPVREGLPSNYRMRADAHYVEQLSGRSSAQTIHLLSVKTLATSKSGSATPSDELIASIRRHNVLQPLLIQRHGGRYRVIDGQKRLAAAIAAGMEEVPCLLHDVEDVDAAALSDAVNVVSREQPPPAVSRPEAPAFGDDVAESLAAVAGAAQLLSRANGSLSRLAALNLINAEMWRAECLLDGARLADGKRRIANALASPVRIVESVSRHMAAEARLRAAHLDVRTMDVPGAARVYSDEDLVVKALSLLAMSTLIWLENVPAARITVRVASRGTRSVAFEVFQDAVAVPPAWFPTVAAGADQLAGTTPATIWVVGARQIAEALGAQLAASPAGAIGTVMSIALPMAKE